MVSEIENTLKYQLIISTALATPVRSRRLSVPASSAPRTPGAGPASMQHAQEALLKPEALPSSSRHSCLRCLPCMRWHLRSMRVQPENARQACGGVRAACMHSPCY
jgi:hypothetical protein